MTWSDRDYLEFWAVPGESREAWLAGRFPTGVPGHWWMFVLESARADLSRFKATDVAGRQRSVDFAVEVIELAARRNQISGCRAAALLARLWQATRKWDDWDRLPAILAADEIAARALASFPLTQQEALDEAERRRAGLVAGEGWYTPGGPPFSAPPAEDRRAQGLVEIEETLGHLEPLAESVADASVRRRLSTWLSLRERFDIGEEAARAGREALARPDQPPDGVEP